MTKILTESQLKDRIFEIYQEEYIKIINEKWEQLSQKDKIIVFEMMKVVYPDKVSLINEAKWYNTAMDFIGIVDPTGLVDLVNGISYWRQGDKLYAVLSWISVIPYLGDLIAKPIIGLLKVGGGATKAFRAAALTGDAVKIAATAKRAGGPIAKMVETAPTWGSKLVGTLRKSVGRVPGVGKGLVNSVEEYVKIFGNASKEIKLPSKTMKGGKLVNVEKSLSSVEKQELLKQLEKEQSRVFSNYKGMKNSWLDYMMSSAPLGQKISAGVPRIFGGNPATRSLMRRTKFYLGFLDWLGLANFVGPEELEREYEDIEKKYNEYAQTEEGQQLWREEMGGVVDGETAPTPPSPDKSDIGKQDDALSSLINGLLGNAIKFV